VAAEARAFVDFAASIDLPLLDFATTEEGASCAIPLLNLPDWDRCRARLEDAMRVGVSLTPGVALVSLVGDGLTTAARALPSFLAVLDEVGATPLALRAGPLRIAATIESAKLADAQRALHATFIGS
jgi:aspartate kinase